MASHKAFSLIELLLSVSIISVLVILAVTRLSVFSAYWLYREQDQLAMVITYVQRKAMVTNTVQKIILDPEKNSYRYNYPGIKPKTTHLAHGVSFGFLSGSYGPPAHPEQLVTNPITFQKTKNGYEIICYPDGTMSAGTIYLLDHKKVTMVALTVNVGTFAVVRKYKQNNLQWLLIL